MSKKKKKKRERRKKLRLERKIFLYYLTHLLNFKMTEKIHKLSTFSCQILGRIFIKHSEGRQD